MKITHIKVNKALLFFAFVLFASSANSQDIASAIFGQSKADYIGQLNYNGKRKNGFGIERGKNGAVYIGDFSEDKMSGRGMLVSLTKGIANVPDAVVYVGNWLEGKKNGKGSCYASDGSLIFKGRFSNDKPTSENTASESPLQRFNIGEYGIDFYMGEETDGVPDGFGLTIEDEGNILLGRMQEGIRQGIGMVLYSLEAWEVGKWTDGDFKAFNNSQAAANMTAAYKADLKAYKKQIRSDLFDAASNFAQAGLTTVTLVNEIKADKNSGNQSSSEEGGNIASGKSYDYYLAQYRKWESKAKNSYGSRVKYKANSVVTGDSGSSRIASGESGVLKNYQKLMRSVRLKARQEGFNIPQSEYETVSF